MNSEQEFWVEQQIACMLAEDEMLKNSMDLVSTNEQNIMEE